MIHGTIIAAICGALLIVYLARRGRKSLAANAPAPTVTAQDSTYRAAPIRLDELAAKFDAETKPAPKKRSPRKVKK
jgi:hypothetical protein